MLRAAEPKYAALICTGIKLDRRAVKSRVDGTGFSVIRSDRPLLPAQHTITVRWELRRQWLDPKNEDRIKAAAILSMEQDRRPNHSATVVLVSSVDPDEVLIRDVHTRAMPGMIVDLWPGLRSLTSWTAIPRPVASPLTVQYGRDQAIEDGSTRDSPRVSRSVSSARRHVATRCCSVFPRATRAAVARATEVKHRVTVLVALPSSRRISMRLLSMSSTLECAISEIRNRAPWATPNAARYLMPGGCLEQPRHFLDAPIREASEYYFDTTAGPKRRFVVPDLRCRIVNPEMQG